MKSREAAASSDRSSMRLVIVRYFSNWASAQEFRTVFCVELHGVQSGMRTVGDDYRLAAPGKIPAANGGTRTVTCSRSLISAMCASCLHMTSGPPNCMRRAASWMIPLYGVGLTTLWPVRGIRSQCGWSGPMGGCGSACGTAARACCARGRGRGSCGERAGAVALA